MYKKSIPNILENMTSAIDEFFVKKLSMLSTVHI